jgi:predicted transglutaminase-like cysteine proteinase
MLTKSLQNFMFKSIFVSLACILPCLMLSVFPLNRPLHYQIASDPALKGKGKDGQCMDYAIALSSRLAAKGIHGQLIFYRWHIRNTATNGSHVFVAYRLSDGTKWIVDNELPHPKAVPVDASQMQLVYLLAGSASAPVEVKLQEGLNQLSFF